LRSLWLPGSQRDEQNQLQLCVPNFRFDNIDGEDRQGSGAM
jgi:hypothetical protein